MIMHIRFQTVRRRAYWLNMGVLLLLFGLGTTGMLLVGDAEPFAARGGMINFFIRNDTVGFAINVEAAARARLTFHSRLLKIAELVKEPGE